MRRSMRRSLWAPFLWAALATIITTIFALLTATVIATVTAALTATVIIAVTAALTATVITAVTAALTATVITTAAAVITATTAATATTATASRAATPALILLASATHAVTFELLHQMTTKFFAVHEVAVSSTTTNTFVVLAATGVVEIGHRREFWQDRSSSIEPSIECCKGFSTAFLVLEHDINIPDHVITNVIKHVHLLNHSEL